MDFSVALTLVQTLLQLLDSSSPLRREIKSIWGYKSQLKKLEHTLSFIQSVLRQAEELQQRQQLHLSFPQQASLERLNEVLYDADDLVDEVATLLQRKKLMSGNTLSKEVSLFFSHFNQLKFAINKSREIKKIRKTLDDIEKDHRDFGSILIQQGAGETSQVRSNPRETGSLLCEEDVIVGREDDKTALINMLINPAIEGSVSCVSIFGIGGLGKTTLAQLVYNDENIKRVFQPRMWFCVSNDFDVKSLFVEIYAAATNEPKEVNIRMDKLLTGIQQELAGKKYLLVLDDVWGDITTKWDELKRPLIAGGNRGSRILVTTRSENVAHVVGGQKHELKGLSDAESWNLFERMTLKTRHEMEALNGEKILKKCAAVPLAIRVFGKYLKGQGRNKWMHMENLDLETDGIDTIVPVLKISYYDLPFHLKRCFTYCAIFPKDYVIIKEDLIYLWMAQGFIKPNGQSLEDVGEEYFMNLLERCFFQDVKRSDDGEIISCKMHDLIHDVANNITHTETMLVKDSISSLKAEVCHVFIKKEVLEHETIRFCTRMKRMRTLVTGRPCSATYRSSSNFKISKVKNLRVLSWSVPSYIIKMPKMLGELMHLRYLDLSDNNFPLLPSSITNLLNLQYLKLYGCSALKKLPNDFAKLVNMRYLNLDECNSLNFMPPGMRNMIGLHKLTMFVLSNYKMNYDNFLRQVSISGLEDLKCLKSLRDTLLIKVMSDYAYDAVEVEGRYVLGMEELKKLYIHFCEPKVNYNVEALLESLQPNPNLQKLILCGYLGVRFPNWGMRGCLSKNLKLCLPHLVEVSFYDCSKLEHLPSMSQLPKLRALRLNGLTSLDYVESNSDVDGAPGSRQAGADELVFFPSLKFLMLWNLPRLKGWWLHPNSHAFPELANLSIRHCDELTTFPPCPKGEQFDICVSNVSSDVLCFEDTTRNRVVEINTVNEGYVIISLPVHILLHRPYLTIERSDNIKRLLTRMVFQTGRMPFLLSLTISNCRVMKRLSELGEMRGHLTALETLTLMNLPMLELEYEDTDENISGSSNIKKGCRTSEEEIKEEDNNVTGFEKPWRFLAPTLRYLTLENLPKLVKLPWEMHYLTSLHSLRISKCCNLEELPNWIGCFISLHSIDIDKCEKLKTLPQEMQLLSSVKDLILTNASKELRERCQKPTGADWPKIQHITHVAIYDGSRERFNANSPSCHVLPSSQDGCPIWTWENDMSFVHTFTSTQI